ncbi:MAG: rhodanese-like domain-containing protein [Thermodesulfobacteriota bacterium]
MKRIITVFVSLFLLLTGVACSGGEQTSEQTKAAGASARQVVPVTKTSRSAPIFRSISSREARSLITERKDLLLVDLREAGELKEGFIAGSVLIPMSKLAKGTSSLPADRPMLLICAVGGRSFGVGRYFSAKGYPEIYNLKGGISAWKRAGLPLQYN